MYTILTSKPGEYETELVDGLAQVESYDYYFYGHRKAVYTIAEIKADDIRVNVISADDPNIINRVPIKFFETFNDLDGARSELKQLITFGTLDTRLEKRS